MVTAPKKIWSKIGVNGVRRERKRGWRQYPHVRRYSHVKKFHWENKTLPKYKNVTKNP